MPPCREGTTLDEITQSVDSGARDEAGFNVTQTVVLR